MKDRRFWVLLLAGTLAGCLDSAGEPSMETSALATASRTDPGGLPAPARGDRVFVAAPGRDGTAACTGGPDGAIRFTIEVDRVVGNVAALRQHGLISETLTLEMLVRDLAGDARILVNGASVSGTRVAGDGTWSHLRAEVPVEQVRFPANPGPGRAVAPAANTIALAPETGAGRTLACDALAWGAITIESAPLPVLLVHGAFGSSAVWHPLWVPQLEQHGIPVAPDLDLGALDTIANNADKIQAAVDEALLQFGVETLNIVAHSKGGLDARYYIENNDTVANLIQIATPNAGSELADHAQSTFVWLYGILGRDLVNLLQSEHGGWELTTTHMSEFNTLHTANASVIYTSLAGDYTPAQPCILDPDRDACITEQVLLRRLGQGDTFVSLTSAHALGYADKLHFQSGFPNKEAMHRDLLTSQAVFDRLVGLLAGTVPVQTSDMAEPSPLVLGSQDIGTLTAEVPAPNFEHTATQGNLLTPGELRSHTVSVDDAKEVSFLILHRVEDTNVALISPSGMLVDRSTTEGNPSIRYGGGEVMGGRMTSITLDSDAAEVGLWTVEVDGSMLPANAGYSINARLTDPTLRTNAWLSARTLSSGQPLDLFLEVTGDPAAIVSVQARVLLPDGRSEDIVLEDNGSALDDIAGDGIYTARYLGTELAGPYRIGFRAWGNRSTGLPFSREELEIAVVRDKAPKPVEPAPANAGGAGR